MPHPFRLFSRLSPRLRWFLAGGLILSAAFVVFANLRIVRANQDRLYSRVENIPSRETGLVLGANRVLRDGRPNPHFSNRMDAAALLYHAGKVRRLLVSGDNSRSDYDEPSMMKEALIARGVPASAIVCDYAGFRTLDSVIRAHRIFGLDDCTIITQRYHNTRALEMAGAIGLDAVGFCADDVSLRYSARTELREVVSRTVAVLDLYVWHRQPHFPGPREPLPPLGS
ncbi:MAG: ElyC/SanA/YdcF family protein [Opitutaceae bacterium]|jgi:SanA protein